MWIDFICFKKGSTKEGRSHIRATANFSRLINSHEAGYVMPVEQSFACT